MKKSQYFIMLVACLLTIVIVGGTGLVVRQLQQPKEITGQLYETALTDDNTMLFTNLVDAYSVELPARLTIDMRNPHLRAAFRDETLTIEIYRQPVNADFSVENYLHYANVFAANTLDHRIERQEIIRLNQGEAHVLQWSRQPLARVPNDKSYYAAVDLLADRYNVYSFFFKSSRPFPDKAAYLSIVESFQRRGRPGWVQPPVEATPSLAQWQPATRAVFTRYFSEEAELTWGIFEPGTNGDEDFSVLHAIEERVDYRFPFLIYYKDFAGDFERFCRSLDNAIADDRYLELTLQSNVTEDGGNMVYDILSGKYDNFLRELANVIAARAYPVLMRPFNEMNGDWCAYSAFHYSKDTDLYIALYRYVYQIFDEEGAAPYCIWVWNPNEQSFPNFQWNNGDLYYPGGEYVDVIGLTGYNTGTYYEGETWRSFTEIYDDLYTATAARYQKPMMITEFATSSVGGDKAAWLREMFANIHRYDRIKVAIWWNSCDYDVDGTPSRIYLLDEVDEYVEIFQENLSP